MSIVRSAKRRMNSVRRSGISTRALPLQNHSAPPNGAIESCSSIYKHVTPHGVKSVRELQVFN
jgi:hypothetical protein